MYYEEKLIGGMLKFRTAPDGKWEECSKEKSWDRIAELQDKVVILENALKTARNLFDQYV